LDDNGESIFRQFSTEQDNSVTICKQLPGHGNCYRATSDDTIDLNVDGLTLLEENIDCKLLIPNLIKAIPDRNLDKCDYYSLVAPWIPEQNQEVFLEVLVEHDNKYPVLQMVKYVGQSVFTGVLFDSFIPGEPQDESKLVPYPDVNIYDFRDGHVDNTNKNTFTTKRDAGNEVFVKTLKMQKKIREMLHLPLVTPEKFGAVPVRKTVLRDDIPDQFDAREQWPDCADIIGVITNQDICGSCWAMSSAGVVSDRLCISRNVKTVMSPQYLVYCSNNSGCNGGTSAITWNDLMNLGTVPEDCVPFTARDGVCPSYCKNYTKIDDNVLVRTSNMVFPWGNSSEERVKAIQSEIMQNGPVQANYMVFDDFYSYQSGVYQRTENAEYSGNHAVRLIGWGNENGVDYWLVANSWGIYWGDNGLFKIRRGNNECNFEEDIAAGLIAA